VLPAESVADRSATFDAATLSMIGQRSRTKIRQAAADQYALTDTFTSPQSLRETKPLPSEGEAFDVPGWLIFRTALALVAVASLVFLGVAVSGYNDWGIRDGLLMSLQLVATGVAASYFYRWAMPRRSGPLAAIGRRLIALVPTVVLVVISANLAIKLDVEEVALAALGCGFAQLAIDWRCFFMPRRRRLVHWLPTVICAAIAGAVAGVVGENTDAAIVAIVVTVSLAVTVQLVSPFESGRALAEQPRLEPAAENQGEDSFVVSSSIHRKAIQGVAS